MWKTEPALCCRKFEGNLALKTWLSGRRKCVFGGAYQASRIWGVFFREFSRRNRLSPAHGPEFPGGERQRRRVSCLSFTATQWSVDRRRGRVCGAAPKCSYLVDPASSHMLVSKIKPCMSKYKLLHSETANGSLNQLWFLRSYNPTWITVAILELIHASQLRPSGKSAFIRSRPIRVLRGPSLW